MDRAILARLTARARAAWPAFGAVSAAELEAFLVARVNAERPDESVLAEDLLLACACAKGVRAAHDALWASTTPDIDRAYARIRPPITSNEARHVVLDRLLVVPEGGAARIGQYTGERELLAFVRGLATRALLGIASGEKGPPSLEDSFLRTPASGAEGDPELVRVRKAYFAELRAAFGIAAAMLDPRERALLRYAAVEDINVHAIGLMYGVPRAIAVNSLRAAREKLELRVKKHLGERLRVSDRDLASAGRCVSTQLDLALARTLADG
jgi:RNA polymerase sigma-70 factor, ECF subfamily